MPFTHVCGLGHADILVDKWLPIHCYFTLNYLLSYLLAQCNAHMFSSKIGTLLLICCVFWESLFAAPLFIAFNDFKLHFYLHVHAANTEKSPDHKHAVITPLEFFDGRVKETAVTRLELIFSIVSERDGKTLLKM